MLWGGVRFRHEEREEERRFTTKSIKKEFCFFSAA